VPSGTIGALRNRGVDGASGQILVFLDADVRVTTDWSRRLPEVIESLERQPMRITGSICDVPRDAAWIERYWFAPRKGRNSAHVGSGHMIMTRPFFQTLGGFDETLVTGEDYDLSVRARSRGASIVIDDALRVEHMGFPRTVRSFVTREIWHGGSDFRSISSVLSSRVALAAVVFTLLHLTLIGSLLATSWRLAAMSLGAIAGLCLLSSWNRYRHCPVRIVIVNALLFYVYYSARAASAFLRQPGGRSPRELEPVA
jgi:hypothetical protein